MNNIAEAHGSGFTLVKKLIDISFVLAVILVFWWLLIAVYLVLLVCSGRPVIFRQQRVGQNGSLFTCLKFRTMHLGTVQAGTHEITQNSVTPLGRLLRKTKIDELPQIWNILLGQISLVGPRPCLPSQDELVDLRLKAGVLSIKPGITGWAQVNNVDMSDPKKLVQLDNFYLQNRSISLDLKIILQTFLGKGQGDQVKS